MIQDLLSGPKLVILIILTVIGGLAISLLALFGYVRNGCGENLDQSGPLFAREAIEAITDWNHEAVIDLMPPSARDQEQLVASIRNTCTALRTALGTRTRPVDFRGHAAGNFRLKQKAYATATYTSRCKMEKGSVTITVDLVKDMKLVGKNGPWYLVSFRYDDVDG